MKQFMIARSNMKKNVSATITLCILICIASFLLYTGSSVLFHLGGFLDEKNESFNGPDFIAGVPLEKKESVSELIEEMDGYESMETEDAILKDGCGFRNITQNEKKQIMGFLCFNADTVREKGTFRIIDEGSEKKENSIILPYAMKSGSGYETGDLVEIGSDGVVKIYEVYGFAEDVVFSSPSNLSYYKCFVYDDMFHDLMQEERETNKITYMKIKLKDGFSSSDFDDAFVKETSTRFKQDSWMFLGLNYETMKTGAAATLNVIMALLVVFSVIILVIAMVVIRFTIVMHIEENIRNIGSLEAMGFTNGLIRQAFVIQFAGITVLSYLVGLLIALCNSGWIAGIISSAIGLKWISSPDLLVAGLGLIVTVVLILSITIQATRKVKKITPIAALRSGIHTHNFKKNHLPYDTVNLPFTLHTGLKGMFQNKRQNIAIGIISLMLAFVSIFSATIYYNFVVEPSAFLRIIGMEKGQIIVTYEGEKPEEAKQQIAGLDGVKKVLPYATHNRTLQFGEKEASTGFIVCADYDQVEIQTIYQGRYPVHDNEIAVSNVILKKLGAKIGDVISLKGEGTTTDYLVVGMTEHINQLGQSASITVDGMKRAEADYQANNWYVYLENEKDTERYMDQITDLLSEDVKLMNLEETFITTLQTIVQAVTAICGLFGVICAAVVVLILFFLVKVKLLKERTTIGIQKALGFTTKQLIAHNILSFIPVVFAGVAAGAVLAVFLVDPLTVMMFSIAGVESCELLIFPAIVAGVAVILIVLALLTITGVSARIRRIKPRELFL
ncbi:MAG: ABC transporter permease [Lachnospiraceae bacterium]|nr:ABC transporter permease [Lachnospiraceae bacterium]